ncbi:hypothetical protein GX618_00210 [Candidatus Dojkabacteria bacterium]|uniref:Uncharacterized protein n=1 Tax=Candidatus Dojkabacteria bacterium TaxID=2099670 RepID=A0A847ESB3_9BACT|nr:hypothetical protein [Candidatus Dojkabacteria bacterium]
MKKYSGQAIAIIMVILVVAAVIGASLYSRMIRNKGEVIDTRESSKALEQSGNILDAFITTDIRTLQDRLYEKLTGAGGKITIEATRLDDLTDNIVAYFGEIGLELEELTMDASCSNYKMSFEFAPPSEGPEYKVGDVMAINLSSVPTVPSGCEVELNFPSGDNKIFTVKEVYSDGGVGYKPYELADMKVYCTNNCTGMSPTTSFETWDTKPILTYNMYNFKQNGLTELRVIPLKGTIEIGVSSENCGNIFDQFLIKATSICSGQERTMQVIIPSATNYGYDPMFDYTIYNSNGALAPEVL